ncbi:MAG: molybdopterin-dependent oxidoreductase [Blastocatellia bacterium]|nr:molybdopterin-dependent oxidoreductase [Blastocatellia bacterium]
MELFDSIKQLDESRKRSGRRKFMIGAVGAVASYFGYRWWRDRPRLIAQRVTRYLTPTPDFYTISISPGFASNATRESWRLELFGLAGKRFELTYADLLALERRRVVKTFACVGNAVGGDAMANAEWTATPLAPLVRRALDDPRPGLRVVFYGLDGFYSSVPLDAALDEHAFIAYEMNGAPLSNAHGFPARVLLPNVYGMKQPRWLSKIEIDAGSQSGYWEKRGWCDECSIKMAARIDAAIAQSDGSFLITGTAYCGGRRVGDVQCSFDRGRTWQSVKITSERLPNAWATWEIPWIPGKKGEHLLTARVVDEAGNRQIETYDDSFPSGATGLHRVLVRT